MERIAAQDVTEAIAKAMENADRIKSVVIVYETHEGDEMSHGVIINSETSLANANYMIDLAKNWICSRQ